MNYQAKYRRVAVLWAVLVVLIILELLLSGCEILKNKRKSQADVKSVSMQTNLSKDSSTAMQRVTEIVDAKTVWDWWKTTLQYAPATNYPMPLRGDTSIVNNYLTTPQPQVIIMEGGKAQRDEVASRIDTSFESQVNVQLTEKMDSLISAFVESNKSKASETKGVGVITLCLIGGGLLILNRLLGFIANNYSINKK